MWHETSYGELLALIDAYQNKELDELRHMRRTWTLLFNQWNEKPVTEQEFMPLPNEGINDEMGADTLIDILNSINFSD